MLQPLMIDPSRAAIGTIDLRYRPAAARADTTRPPPAHPHTRQPAGHLPSEARQLRPDL